MPEVRYTNRQSTMSFAVSVLLHAALIFLLPGLGGSPTPALLSKGGSVSVTFVQPEPIEQKGSKQVTAVNSKPTTQVSPKTTTAKPPVTAVKNATAKPVAKPVTPVVKPAAQPKQQVSSSRVLTSDKGVEGGSLKQKVDPTPVTTAKPAQPDPVPQPQPDPEPVAPTAGSVAKGMGLVPRLSGKETEGLTDVVRLKVTVTVPPTRPITARVQNPSSDPMINKLEKLAVYWFTSGRFWEFQRDAKATHELDFNVVIDPQKNTVTHSLASPSEQVRIVKP